MQPIIDQPRPAAPQGPVPLAPERTIGEACLKRAYDECGPNILCGGLLGAESGLLITGQWYGIAVHSLTGAIVGAFLSHNTTWTLYKTLCERPVAALCERRESLCPPCPRLNTVSPQSDEVPVRNI